MKLSEHFDSEEFACKCGCGTGEISMDLVMLLENIRSVLDRPIIITSGVRCINHNSAVGGHDNSAHLRGMAADFAVSGGFDRRMAVDAAVGLDVLGIGVGRTFIHIDMDWILPRPAIWGY